MKLLQNRLIMLIHNMGGSIRRDMVSKVTHLIANSCGGDKYQYAVTFRVPVMSETWVHDMWEKRKETTVSAASEEMVRIRLVGIELFKCSLVFQSLSSKCRFYICY